jgi:hypothetical protein
MTCQTKSHTRRPIGASLKPGSFLEWRILLRIGPKRRQKRTPEAKVRTAKRSRSQRENCCGSERARDKRTIGRRAEILLGQRYTIGGACVVRGTHKYDRFRLALRKRKDRQKAAEVVQGEDREERLALPSGLRCPLGRFKPPFESRLRNSDRSGVGRGALSSSAVNGSYVVLVRSRALRVRIREARVFVQ